ncbi:restriction endonuclease subunit S [Ancylothrix sp. C2]|uniref:restriction endonuclease subunit S n=1 Tax=Ancylothrix sp. D3o TaxID=2953691 RepID=UPI0021BB33B9|nr:restriction endonuclease subunit S [Ancylothrix sp. D3o]MCT7952947.1 restriction endonuclease subunit S [Ancylothrix sp. D3o]
MFNENTNLPDGWVLTTLGQLGEWSSGGTPSRSHSEYYGGDIPWIKTGNLPDGLIEEIDENITWEGLANSSAKVFPKNSLIVAMYGATIGKLGILKESAATNQACAALVSKSLTTEIIPYVFYYLLNRREHLRSIGQGGAQPNISQTVLKEYPCPLPPLNEQRRIVAKIEALKARSQRVKEELEAIPTLLDQFRQSVLAAAFRGDLTADWREKNPDVEPASELLKRIQEGTSKGKTKKRVDNALPDPFELPDEWLWVSLSDICQTITDGDHQSPPKADKGIPFLVISNISQGQLDFNNTRYVPEDYYQSIQTHRKPEKGDIIYSVVGSYGIPVLVNTENRFCFQRHIALLKPIRLLSSGCLLYALKSEFVFTQATKVATGTAQLTVTLSGLRRIKVPLIPAAEQQEIVRRIQSLFGTADKIEQQYQEAQAYLDQLNQSILAKAFRGELVPQDPNDEPASVLLERIRAGRQKREAEAKTAKKSTGKKGGRGSKKAQEHEVEATQLEFPLE